MPDNEDPALAISVERSGDDALIHLNGDLDVEMAGDFQKVVEAELTAPTRHLVIELSGLEFIDSTGMRALILIRNACFEVGTSMTLTEPTLWVRQVLELAGLWELFASD